MKSLVYIPVLSFLFTVYPLQKPFSQKELDYELVNKDFTTKPLDIWEKAGNDNENSVSKSEKGNSNRDYHEREFTRTDSRGNRYFTSPRGGFYIDKKGNILIDYSKPINREFENGRYQGNIIKHGQYSFKFHGKGTYKWEDGSKYTGDWVNDLKHGKGTYIWEDGSKYTGDFVNNKRTGQGEYHSSDDGTTIHYKGGYKEGKSHGKGEYSYGIFSTYRGDFENGQPHGWGVYENSITDIRIANGDWIKGKFVKGIIDYADGSQYNGGVKGHYIRSGDGVLRFPNNGTYIEGFFSDSDNFTGIYGFYDGIQIKGKLKDGKWYSAPSQFPTKEINFSTPVSIINSQLDELFVHLISKLESEKEFETAGKANYYSEGLVADLTTKFTSQMVYSQVLQYVYSELDKSNELDIHQSLLKDWSKNELNELQAAINEVSNNIFKRIKHDKDVPHLSDNPLDDAENAYRTVEKYSRGGIRFHNSNQSIDILSPNTTGVFVIGRNLNLHLCDNCSNEFPLTDLKDEIAKLSTHIFIAVSENGKLTTYGGYKNEDEGMLEIRRNSSLDRYINPETGKYWNNIEVLELQPSGNSSKEELVEAFLTEAEKYTKDPANSQKMYALWATIKQTDRTGNCHTVTKDILERVDPNLIKQVEKVDWLGVNPIQKLNSNKIEFRFFNVFN